MVEKLRQRSNDQSGFTLVELLVVMLILGILAAIAIPTFFNQREKANDAEAKEMVRTAQTAMETYAVDNNNSYTGATATKLKAIEPTIDDARLAVTIGTGTVAYTLEATAKNTAHKFKIQRNTDGSTTFTCTPFSSGGCPASPGNWGA